MIPKKIHYCWFGGKSKPQKVLDCIASWRQFLPDYQIVEWNEENFDIYQNRYAREAYEAQKYAFVSDFARLKILYDEGGIYLDTDIEVVQNFENFLHHGAFMGFEYWKFLATCVIGAEPQHPMIWDFLRIFHFKKNLKTITRPMWRELQIFWLRIFQNFNPIILFRFWITILQFIRKKFFHRLMILGKHIVPTKPLLFIITRDRGRLGIWKFCIFWCLEWSACCDF